MLIIGSNNVFEVDCTVESPKIGNNNVFESKCYVGNKITVSNGCTIGAGCRITEEQILKENVIIFGSKCQMREGLDRPGVSICIIFQNFKNIINIYYYNFPASDITNGNSL